MMEDLILTNLEIVDQIVNRRLELNSRVDIFLDYRFIPQHDQLLS